MVAENFKHHTHIWRRTVKGNISQWVPWEQKPRAVDTICSLQINKWVWLNLGKAPALTAVNPQFESTEADTEWSSTCGCLDKWSIWTRTDELCLWRDRVCSVYWKDTGSIHAWYLEVVQQLHHLLPAGIILVRVSDLNWPDGHSKKVFVSKAFNISKPFTANLSLAGCSFWKPQSAGHADKPDFHYVQQHGTPHSQIHLTLNGCANNSA